MLKDIFDQLVLFLGGRGTSFMSTMLFVIIIYIGVGFVFKIFRLRITYSTFKKKK